MQWFGLFVAACLGIFVTLIGVANIVGNYLWSMIDPTGWLLLIVGITILGITWYFAPFKVVLN